MPTRAAIKRMQMEFDFSFSPLHFPIFSSVFFTFFSAAILSFCSFSLFFYFFLPFWCVGQQIPITLKIQYGMKADSETQTLFYFIDAEKSSEIKRVWGVSAVSFGNDLNTLPHTYTLQPVGLCTFRMHNVKKVASLLV